MPSIRQPLAGLDPSACDHPYLAFERLIQDSSIEKDGKRQHQVTALQHDIRENLRAAYVPAFDRRYKALEGFTGGIEGAVTRFYSLPVQGRLAAGLGNASVLENGMSLNHTYGLPYLPGTGLKGMASAMAHLGLDAESWQRGKEENGKWTRQGTDHKVLFGTMDTGAEDAAAGIVIFHDAWWDPAPDKIPAKRLPFEPDVMTPHHQKYNLDGADWPNDWESPIPVPYMTVSGTFRLALTGPSEWVEAAFEILKMAFQHLGFGAKTQIGYGRGDLDRHESEIQASQREARENEQKAEQAEAKRIAERAEADRTRTQREASKREIAGKLIPTDSGRGIYRLAFGEFKLETQMRAQLKSLAGDNWDAIAADAKKRGDRGGRVKVSFWLENDCPVLLGLAPDLPPSA
jgi:CRISPR type III-B/RAMP module RAMP protein Cmr6